MMTPQQFGALGDGIQDDAPAFARMFDAFTQFKQNSAGSALEAITVGQAIHIPAGIYKLSTADFGRGQPFKMSKLRILGEGRDQARIDLPPGAWFLNIDGVAQAIELSDLCINGGAGGVLLSSSRNVAREHFRFHRNTFHGFTSAGIAQINATDCGRLDAHDNFFTGRGIGIAWEGWNDNSVISLNRFHGCKYGLKLGHSNTRSWICQNSFMRTSSTPAQVDVWIVPCAAGTRANFGDGSVFRENRFGNEFLTAADYRILLADEGEGADFLSREHVERTSLGILRRTAFRDNFVGLVPGGQPLLTSYTRDVLGLDFVPISQTYAVKGGA